MPESKGQIPLNTWLSDRPPEFARILAARSALRLVPLLVESISNDAHSRRSTILLPSLRVLVSASLAAGSTDRADEILSEANALAREVTELIETTAFDVHVKALRLKENLEPECIPIIHAHEADEKGLQGAKKIMNAAESAMKSSIYHVDFVNNVASKDAPISAASETMDACILALYHLYDGHVLVADSGNDPIRSKDNIAKFDIDEVMAEFGKIRQEMQTLCSIDSDIEDVATHLSFLSPSKDYIASFSNLKGAIKRDMQVLCAIDVDAKGIAYCLSVLSQQPLWFDSIPIWVSEKWMKLKNAMPKEEGWTVWINWYESHLRGESRNETVEGVLSTIPSEIWQDDVAQINSYLLEAVQTQWDPTAIALTDGLKEVEAVSNSLELGQYRRRIMTALADDPSQAIGGTKDLLEAVMKTILHRRGCELEENIKFNELINTCWSELNLDSQNQPFDESEGLLRRISSLAKKMIESANKLRNIAGSGHGRIVGNEHPLTTEDARMIASIGFVLAGWLVRCEKKLNLPNE